MTVQVARSFVIDAPREDVWAFISDARKRAESISVVDSFELHDPEGREATWQVALPIPLLRRTVSVETRETERRPPEYVRFQGRSTALRVTGEHELRADGDGTRLENRFVVDGRLPGVERYFTRNLEREFENLAQAIADELDVDVRDA